MWTRRDVLSALGRSIKPIPKPSVATIGRKSPGGFLEPPPPRRGATQFSHPGDQRVLPSVAQIVRRIGYEADLEEPIAHPDDRTAVLFQDEAVKFGTKNEFAGQRRVALSAFRFYGLTERGALRAGGDVDEGIGSHFRWLSFFLGSAGCGAGSPPKRHSRPERGKGV